MRTTIAVIVLGLGLALIGCEDNEMTFYIEHAKVQPDAPECSASAGDDITTGVILDLALGRSISTWYYVTNAAVVREDYDNLKAESNGIMVEGMEVYVHTSEGAIVGGTSYFVRQKYLPPETSDILSAVVVPTEVGDALADYYGCGLARDSEPGEWNSGFDGWMSVFSVVRFLGHTQGGIDVETQEFSMVVDVCCGQLIDWANCGGDPCQYYCEDPVENPFCGGDGASNSVNDKLDCASLYSDSSFDCSTCAN